MKTMFAVIAAAAFLASTAHADYLKGDPRVCELKVPATCLNWSARLVVRQAVARRQHLTRWDGSVFCKPIHGNPLHQACVYMQGDVHGDATLTFKQTATGWRRIVTFT